MPISICLEGSSVKTKRPHIELKVLNTKLWGPEGPDGHWHLPEDERDSDRWERARSLGFGEDSCVHLNSYILGNITVGRHSWIGPFTLLDGSGGLEIGDFCMICAGVQIYTHDSVKWALSEGNAEPERSPVKIGDCCYLGAGTIVTRGVTIGTHTVVGAGSVVNRDLPPFCLAVGSPCRMIGRVEMGEDGTVRLIRE